MAAKGMALAGGTGDTIFLSGGIAGGESIRRSELPIATEGQRVEPTSKWTKPILETWPVAPAKFSFTSALLCR